MIAVTSWIQRGASIEICADCPGRNQSPPVRGGSLDPSRILGSKRDSFLPVFRWLLLLLRELLLVGDMVSGRLVSLSRNPRTAGIRVFKRMACRREIGHGCSTRVPGDTRDVPTGGDSGHIGPVNPRPDLHLFRWTLLLLQPVFLERTVVSFRMVRGPGRTRSCRVCLPHPLAAGSGCSSLRVLRRLLLLLLALFLGGTLVPRRMVPEPGSCGPSGIHLSHRLVFRACARSPDRTLL